MEKRLNCFSLLSLKEAALRTVATCFWNDPDILATVSGFYLFGFCSLKIKKEWRETVENKIINKMSELDLPTTIMQELIGLVRPISLDVRRWKGAYQGYFYACNEEIGLPGPAKLCFTAAGSVDYRRTAEELVRCRALGVVRRYRIACYHCLEDYIPLLWDELPEEIKDNYRSKRFRSICLEYCWPHLLEGELSNLDYLLTKPDRNFTTFNQRAFEFSAKNLCKTAAEYFYQKCTLEEKEVSLMRTGRAVLSHFCERVFPEERLSDVLCYLFCLMTSEQQREIIEADPVKVFLCFLDWPRQDLLSENAGLLWSFLPPGSYADLLHQVIPIFEDCYMPKVFQEFFVHSPLKFKNWFMTAESAHRCLTVIFEFGDRESVEVIFRNVVAAERLKLVFQDKVLNFFYRSILENRWRMVEACLREAMLSESDKDKLKRAFVRVNGIQWKNPKLKEFSEFLNETEASDGKEKKSRKRRKLRC